MTVAELVAKLQQMPQDATVVYDYEFNDTDIYDVEITDRGYVKIW